MYDDVRKQLKIWDFDAHSLRGKNFFKGVVEYRKKILPIHRHQIKKDKDFVCVLCGAKKGVLFLEWKEGYRLFFCKRCEAVSPNIFATKAHFDDTYNNEIYFDKFRREILANYEYRKNTQGIERFNYCVRRLKIKSKNPRVLDVGCGGGYFLSVLKEHGIYGRGLEINPAQVRFCKSSGLDVSSSDLSEEPNDDYDVITMFDVLEHLTEPIKTLKTSCEKLKRGGYLIAYTPNIHSLAFALMGSDQNTLLPFEHYCFYNRRSFEYLASRSGFRIESLDVFGLDVMDYLFMKEYQDGFEYTVKLREFMNLMQACVDKLGFGNHFRLTLKKK